MTYRDFRHLRLPDLLLPSVFSLGLLMSPASLLVFTVVFAGLVVALARVKRPV